METVELKLYTNLNKKHETYKMNAIKDNNVIKYIDLENNKIVLDMNNNIMIRENCDYIFSLDFNKNVILINIKGQDKIYEKEIETILVERSSKKYYVKYKLIDENFINEYQIKF